MDKKKYLILIAVIILPFIYSCSSKLSTEELAKQVQEQIIEYTEELDGEFTVTKDLILAKQNETEYIGAITILEKNTLGLENISSQTYLVNVIYDGKHFVWKISQ